MEAYGEKVCRNAGVAKVPPKVRGKSKEIPFPVTRSQSRLQMNLDLQIQSYRQRK